MLCCYVAELKLPRYKYLVQVIIGENKGAGVRCGARCFWDQTTDKIAQTHFTNVSRHAIIPTQACRLQALPVAGPAIMSASNCASLSLLSSGWIVCVSVQDTMFCVVAAFGVYLY